MDFDQKSEEKKIDGSKSPGPERIGAARDYGIEVLKNGQIVPPLVLDSIAPSAIGLSLST